MYSDYERSLDTQVNSHKETDMADVFTNNPVARAKYKRTVAQTALLRAKANVTEAERRLAEAEEALRLIESEGGK